MSEYFYGQISIGGKLPAALVPDFIEVLTEDISGDFDEEHFTNDLEACKLKPQHLEYSDSEANWGHFEGVESFCVKHGLIYHAKADANYDTMAESKFFDGTTESTVITDTDFDPIMGKYHVLKYLEVGKELLADPTKVPLHINSEVFHYKQVADLIMKFNITDPLTLLEKVIEMRYPDHGPVPVLEII
jgi:hypothetical protein